MTTHANTVFEFQSAIHYKNEMAGSIAAGESGISGTDRQIFLLTEAFPTAWREVTFWKCYFLIYSNVFFKCCEL